MVLMTAFPDLRLASVAKHSLFETPLVSLFLEAMETVPVAQQYDVGLPAHKQPTAQERARMNAQVAWRVWLFDGGMQADCTDKVMRPLRRCSRLYKNG